jgi:hypothetical protein
MENKIVKLNFLDFYTVWSYIILIISIIMILLFKNLINTYKNLIALTVLIMLIIVSIGGFILTHIYPKYIYLEKINLLIRGKDAFILDIILHQTPLIIYLGFLYYNKKYISFSRNLLGLALLINILILDIYLLYVNPFDIYLPNIKF